MILLTGPGRSGTSFIAQLYQVLGFDPGGEWVEAINGGLEPAEIVKANEEILEALGLAPMGAPGGMRGRFRRAGKAIVPAAMQARLRYALRRMPWMGSAQPPLMRWGRYGEVAERFAPRLQALAAKYPVAKDPRWFWTLPVWARAGVPIEHVLISLRSLDAIVESRGRMDSVRFFDEVGIRNSIVYGLGLSLFAVAEHGLDYAIVRFPGFLDHPEQLYEACRFPEPVSRDRFMEAFASIVRPELVHDAR